MTETIQPEEKTDETKTPSAPSKKSLEDREKALLERMERDKKLLASVRVAKKNDERKLETRRKILLGAYVLHKIETDADLLKNAFFKDFPKFLTKDRDLACFDFEGSKKD